MVAVSLSAAARNSAAAFGSSVMTVQPARRHRLTESASCARRVGPDALLERLRGAVTDLLSSALIRFQAVLVMTIAPIERRDAQVEHVLRVAEDLQRQREVRRARAPCRSCRSSASAARECRWASSATGWKPFDLYHCTDLSSPWLVKSLALFTSASVRSGFFEKSCTQPPLPQLRQMEALGLELLLEHGVSFCSTAISSSSLWKKNGMPNTLNASSSCARPTAIRRWPAAVDARAHHPDRRRFVALGAPGYTVSLTRPLVFVSHVLAHVEQRLVPGRIHGRLGGELDRAGRGQASARARRTSGKATRNRFRADIVLNSPPSAVRAGGPQSFRNRVST